MLIAIIVQNLINNHTHLYIRILIKPPATHRSLAHVLCQLSEQSESISYLFQNIHLSLLA